MECSEVNMFNDTNESQGPQGTEQNSESPESSSKRKSTKGLAANTQEETATSTFVKPSTPKRKKIKKYRKGRSSNWRSFSVLAATHTTRKFFKYICKIFGRPT